MSLTQKIVILFSGEGSNMEAIIRSLHKKEFEGFQVHVVATLTNNPNAKGIERSKELGIPCEVIDHRAFESREAFDAALALAILAHRPNLTVLAGFMRILSPLFLRQIRAINIHPSLLPLFKGGNAMQESYLSPMKVAGVSVHYVSEELDSGDLIAQEAVGKIEGESFEEFKARLHSLEHRLYPEAILRVLKERVTL